MTDPIKHAVKCPHPECDAVLKIPARTPAGDYPCICKSCTVRLSWALYLKEGLRPYVALVEGKPAVRA